MNPDTCREIENLARGTGYVFIATANEEGYPHIAAAEKIHFISPDRLSIAGWFCPATESNIARNPKIAMVVWDRVFDHGYQVIGKRECEEDIAILDGYSPALENQEAYPQVERELVLRVEKILEFHHAQHSDEVNVKI